MEGAPTNIGQNAWFLLDICDYSISGIYMNFPIDVLIA